MSEPIDLKQLRGLTDAMSTDMSGCKQDKVHLERIVTLTPAFDRRHADPPKNYGIHGVDLRMVLKGPLGAVQFVAYTDWFLPHVQAEKLTMSREIRPMGCDVGYHSPVSMYEGQTSMGPCEYLDGQPCYYDGSTIRADEWVREILLPKGSDGIWAALEADYHKRFKSGGAT